MIVSLTLEELLSFQKAHLLPDAGLNVFSGPSGAGKSVLMEALLSFFGHKEVKATQGMMEVEGDFAWEDVGFEPEDEAIIRTQKKEKVRYFLNDQTITKKGLSTLSGQRVKYLSLKEATELSSSSLLSFIDATIALNERNFAILKDEYHAVYNEHKEKTKAYHALLEKQENSEQLREIALFECAKIDAINPKIGEDDELLEVKKNLSRLDKFQAAIDKASTMLVLKEKTAPLFELLDLSTDPIEEALSAIEEAIFKASSALDMSGEIDPEKILDRLEQLGSLVKRYGSLEAAITYLDTKKKELLILEDLEGEIALHVKKIALLEGELEVLAQKISVSRNALLPLVTEKLNAFLQMVFLPSAFISLEKCVLKEEGADEATLGINGVAMNKLSSGEFNRLRLAWMATRSSFDPTQEGQILFLDEIDANVSGEESHSVGKVLKFLAQKHQIFAISHQPQLTSLADAHFLVTKQEGMSCVQKLDEEGRIGEIARIISGESINDDALKYARSLREGSVDDR